MIDKPAVEVILAADMAGTGQFTPAGSIREPSLALATAIKDFQDKEADADRRNALIYAIGSRIAGRCMLASPEIAIIVEAWVSARIVAEWRITMPGTGIVQALFLPTRLQPAGNVAGQFDFALQLAGPLAFDAFASLAEPGA